jgi:hypothetical protein
LAYASPMPSRAPMLSRAPISAHKYMHTYTYIQVHVCIHAHMMHPMQSGSANHLWDMHSMQSRMQTWKSISFGILYTYTYTHTHTHTHSHIHTHMHITCCLAYASPILNRVPMRPEHSQSIEGSAPRTSRSCVDKSRTCVRVCMYLFICILTYNTSHVLYVCT